MLKIIRLLLAAIAAVLIVGFAVANRTPVPVSFAPFPILIELPVYAVFMIGLVFGVLVGGISVWLGAMAKRRELRRLRSKVWALENQLTIKRQQEEKAEAARYASQRSLAAREAAD